jgi:hypothetical protein
VIIQIPKSQVALVRAFIALPAERRGAITRTLAEAPLKPTLGEYLSEVATRSRLPDQDRPVLQAFIAMQSTRLHYKQDPDEFADGVIASASTLNLFPGSADENFRRELRQQLITALGDNSNLVTVAKAIDLMGSNEHTFSSARIITDVRYVFSRDLTPTPTASIIVHTLQIEDLESDKDMFVVLTRTDLDTLREIIDRAIKKDETLAKLVAQSGSIVVRMDQED